MPGRYSLLPDNLDDIDALGLPSPNELVWTTTMSYCNMYRLTYKMFMAAGIPVQRSVISNDLMATVLIPDDFDESSDPEDNGDTAGSTVKFLRFRKASHKIEEVVFKINPFAGPANADEVRAGLALWDSVETTTVNFMTGVSGLTDRVEQATIDLFNASDVDPMSMMYLYRDTCDRMVTIMSNGTVSFNNAFGFIASLNPSFYLNMKPVSENRSIYNSCRWRLEKLWEIF